MRTITLLKPHWEGKVCHPAGAVIEVSEQTYQWLMKVYQQDRAAEVEAEKKAADFVAKFEKVIGA